MKRLQISISVVGKIIRSIEQDVLIVFNCRIRVFIRRLGDFLLVPIVATDVSEKNRKNEEQKISS
jgi:hypothetical protein